MTLQDGHLCIQLPPTTSNNEINICSLCGPVQGLLWDIRRVFKKFVEECTLWNEHVWLSNFLHWNKLTFNSISHKLLLVVLRIYLKMGFLGHKTNNCFYYLIIFRFITKMASSVCTSISTWNQCNFWQYNGCDISL